MVTVGHFLGQCLLTPVNQLRSSANMVLVPSRRCQDCCFVRLDLSRTVLTDYILTLYSYTTICYQFQLINRQNIDRLQVIENTWVIDGDG